MPTIPASMAPLIDRYMAETGQTADSPKQAEKPLPNEPEAKPGKRGMVQYAFDPAGTWQIPIWLASEANVNGSMRAAMARKKAVKDAIWRGLGQHWKVWGPIGDRVRAAKSGDPVTSYPSIRVIRLGGRGLDVGNLWRSVKAVEDALAVLLGCDDGMAAWKQSFFVAQEPGPLWGCRIEMRLPPLTRTDGKEQ